MTAELNMVSNKFLLDSAKKTIFHNQWGSATLQKFSLIFSKLTEELMFSELLLQQPHPEPHTQEKEREAVIFHVEVPLCHSIQTPN